MKKMILLTVATMMLCTVSAQTRPQSEIKKVTTTISKKLSKIYKDAKKSVNATAKTIDKEIGSIRVVRDTTFYQEKQCQDSIRRDSIEKEKIKK